MGKSKMFKLYYGALVLYAALGAHVDACPQCVTSIALMCGASFSKGWRKSRVSFGDSE